MKRVIDFETFASLYPCVGCSVPSDECSGLTTVDRDCPIWAGLEKAGEPPARMTEREQGVDAWERLAAGYRRERGISGSVG